MSDRSTEIQGMYEELLREAREMKRGGDLAGLLNRGIRKICGHMQEGVVAERASHEADFPPSGLPSLSGRDADAADGDEAARRGSAPGESGL